MKKLPNIKSAIKRVKISKVKTLKNSIQKSNLRTTLRKCKESIINNDVSASQHFRNAISVIDKAVSKKILHKNNAARKKSKLSQKFNAMNLK